MIVVAFGSTPFINHDTLVKSAPKYANLPAKIPGVDINGFNGKLKQGGVWVDQYKANNIPEGTYFVLGLITSVTRLRNVSSMVRKFR